MFNKSKTGLLELWSLGLGNLYEAFKARIEQEIVFISLKFILF